MSVSNNYLSNYSEEDALQAAIKASLEPTSRSIASSSRHPASLPAAPWRRRAFTIEETVRKMLKNARKAIEEHQQKYGSVSAPVEKALPSIQDIMAPRDSTTLSFSHGVHAKQGVRATMEDAHFYVTFPEGVLTGVFDGHGGKEVAEYVNREFSKRFPARLRAFHGNVHHAFENLISEIHEEVIKKRAWDTTGTTAAISFIDKKNTIYTATVADTEANIYRMIDGEMKSISLSCEKNWSKKSEAARAEKFMGRAGLATEWMRANDTKQLRVHGVNISRSIGDQHALGTRAKPGVIAKPKITVQKLLPGDIIVHACDGFKDYVSEKNAVEQIQAVKTRSSSEMAEHLVDYALRKDSKDNVSVSVIKVGPVSVSRSSSNNEHVRNTAARTSSSSADNNSSRKSASSSSSNSSRRNFSLDDGSTIQRASSSNSNSRSLEDGSTVQHSSSNSQELSFFIDKVYCSDLSLATSKPLKFTPAGSKLHRFLPPQGQNCPDVPYHPACCYKDGDILNKASIVYSEEVPKIKKAPNGKTVIQQQALRGCTAGVSAMLIADHGKQPKLGEMQQRDLGEDVDVILDIRDAGLKEKVSNLTDKEQKPVYVTNAMSYAERKKIQEKIRCSLSLISELKKLIEEHGSAIVSIHGEIGGHVIVVDAIDDDLTCAIIRDPFHGWMITISMDAFRRTFSGGSIIQIAK